MTPVRTMTRTGSHFSFIRMSYYTVIAVQYDLNVSLSGFCYFLGNGLQYIYR